MAYIPPLNGGRVNIAAGGATASTGTVVFSNTNGVTFGLAGNVVTASVAAGNAFLGGISTNGNTLGTTGFASNQLMMVGGNNITLSQSVGTGASSGSNTLTIVGPTQSAQTQSNVQSIIAQGGTASTGSVSFANANGVSFSMAGNVMSASVAAGGTDILGMSNLGNTSGTTGIVNASAVQYIFAGGNNVTLNQSLNGASGTVTINAQSQSAQTQSNVQAIMAAGGTATTGSVSFANANGIGFGMNGNTMTASHNALTSQSLQTQSIIQGLYDGAITVSSGMVSLQDGNGVSFGLNGNTLTGSVAPGGVALAGGVAGTSTTITSGTANLSVGGGAMTISGSNQSLNFYVPGTSSLAGVNGISLSANGSTISIGGAAGGGGVTLSRWEYPNQVFTTIGALSQSQLSVQHVYVPFNVTGTAAKIALSIALSTFTSASTASVNNSLWMGVYTLNGSTLSLSASGSANNNLSWANTASSATYTNIMSGLRQLTVPISLNMPAGEYWIAAVNVSASTFASASLSLMGNNQIATLGQIGVLGVSSTSGRDVFLGQGIFSANTTAGPTSIVLSNINNAAASNAMRAAFYHAIINAIY